MATVSVTQRLEVTPEEEGQRLDRYVAGRLAELSRATVQKLIDEGNVLVNHAPAKASYRVAEGDVVEVALHPAEHEPEAVPIPLDVLYEDGAIVVLNKPAGLVVHPAHGHVSDTLVNALLARYPELQSWPPEEGFPGLVHRLDRDTSGVLLVARTVPVRDALRAQFKAGTVRKVYLALVIGRPRLNRARIEAPIARDARERKRMAVVSEGGREAITEYEVLEPLGSYTLLEVRLVTGRTHQVRVHLAAIGHPVAGDRVYGPERQRLALDRVFLHAAELTFRHPISGDEMTFRAPLPPELEEVLSQLRR
ncbi:MAG: RluA family pseudouridine synthase [Anaerolineae bacterium]|nr:RluA family pseudouridine synthase [Anaerolineae bacterium]